MRLERIDSKGNYKLSNCRFGTKYKDRGVNKGIQANILANKQKKADAGIEGKRIEDELYVVYHGMHSRCERKSHSSYENYGGRGVSVCEEWSGKDGFLNFRKEELIIGIHPDDEMYRKTLEMKVLTKNYK